MTRPMAAALERADVNAARNSAYTTAVFCLKADGGQPNAALRRFYGMISAEAGALVEIIGENQIKTACLVYLTKVAEHD